MSLTAFLIIGLMMMANAIFAAYEMALASISRARLTVLVHRKRKGAEEAAFMKDRMESSLAVVQVGITLVGAIAAAAGGVGVSESLTPYLQAHWGYSKGFANFIALVVLIVPLSALTIIFAELIPKMFALNNRERICLQLSPVMKILSLIAYPVITVMERIVKWTILQGQKSKRLKPRHEDEPGLHELTAAASLARAARLIGTREEKIVLSAAHLSIRPVKEIMSPAADISMIPLECTLTDALIRAHLDMHTRFPVCAKEDDPQTIAGYINFKDIIMALKLNPADPSIRGIVRPIKSVQSETPISQVLEIMMQEKLHIALVNSLEKTVVGMVTLEDIIEELVGEIEDEFDRLPTYIHPYGSGWIMGGGVPMNVVVQTSGISLPEHSEDASLKLAEWFSKKIGRSLKGGEILQSEGLYVVARKLRRKKLGEAIVSAGSKSIKPPEAAE